MMGLPGSGKSTYSKSNFPHHIIISQDDFKGNKKKFLERYNALLQLNDNIVIDRCNINKSQRKMILSIAKAKGLKRIKCVFLDTDKDVCLKRLKERNEHPTLSNSIGDERLQEILNIFSSGFEFPELEEGFEEITHVNVVDDKLFITSETNTDSRS